MGPGADGIDDRGGFRERPSGVSTPSVRAIAACAASALSGVTKTKCTRYAAWDLAGPWGSWIEYAHDNAAVCTANEAATAQTFTIEEDIPRVQFNGA